MPSRHAILYDVVRWRGNRLLLLLFATVFLLTTAFTLLLRPSSGVGLYPVMSVFLYGIAASLWLRQRFTYLTVEGDELVVHIMGRRQRVPLDRVRRARVARLGTVFDRPDRRRLLPGRGRRWLDEPALMLRLGGDPDELDALRRGLGRKFVIEDSLVVPVVDADRLLADIERVRPAASGPGAGASRGARRRRR
ncbi:MAG: hypothetical protein E6J14_04955 [Chloroflexi bacterium]|nr:MAG: hypothetical protein E6J14_04955 [Chloroflexota bacterium]